jgi:hypothetical protein
MRRRGLRLLCCRAIGGKITGECALEDPEVMQGNLRKAVRRHAEILGKHLGRRMCKPVRHEQCVELVCMAVVEADHEFATVRPETLQGVRSARGKIPEIAFFHVSNIRPAFRIKDGNSASAVGHDGPFGGLMPMQLPNASGGKAHVDAGDFFRDRKVIDGHLTRPATVLDALGGIVE